MLCPKAVRSRKDAGMLTGLTPRRTIGLKGSLGGFLRPMSVSTFDESPNQRTK
ncbi:MAG: hypothetical protein GVY08_14075 [Bacteroidetes bacterium]|jgi:hypothetical protein|nr:hypothetical protein [Bacteroidota bacterium]